MIRMASLTQWTWVWVNSGSWWWTGRPGMLWFMGSQRVGHDWVTELNWTDFYGLTYGVSWRMFHIHLRMMCILMSLSGVFCRCLSVRSSWFIVLLKSSVSLLICPVVLPIVETGLNFQLLVNCWCGPEVSKNLFIFLRSF